MPESKIIKFDTEFKTNGDGSNTLTVALAPESSTPNTVQGELNMKLNYKHINNKHILPGHLCMVMKNHLEDIDFHVYLDGGLIVNAEDSKDYSINEQGHLIYTYR